MSYYRICPDCGCSLDPGERCDCLDKEKAAPDATNIQSGKRWIKSCQTRDPSPILSNDWRKSKHELHRRMGGSL